MASGVMLPISLQFPFREPRDFRGSAGACIMAGFQNTRQLLSLSTAIGDPLHKYSRILQIKHFYAGYIPVKIQFDAWTIDACRTCTRTNPTCLTPLTSISR